MFDLYGIDVVPTRWLRDPITETRRRSWRTRLLSWPWRPWVTEETVVVGYKPSETAYLVDLSGLLSSSDKKKLFIHPDSVSMFTQSLT